MLPDWMAGAGFGAAASAKSPKKSKPAPKSNIPAWSAPQRSPKSVADELGITAGALTPAADQAKSPLKQNDESIMQALGLAKSDEEKRLADMVSEDPEKEQLKALFGAADSPQSKKVENYNPDKKAAPVQRMTREEYLALPAEARAAVDFNTMLVQARRADRKLNPKDLDALEDIFSVVPTKATAMPDADTMRASNGSLAATIPGVNLDAVIDYDAGNTVEPARKKLTGRRYGGDYGEMFSTVFGENPIEKVIPKDGSVVNLDEYLAGDKLARVSPEVLSVLKQVGYKSDDPKDMERFLDLRNGIAQSDIDKYLNDNDTEGPSLAELQAGLGAPEVKSDREKFVEKIAGLTMDLQKKLADGDKMIADFQTSALKDREGERLFLGADPKPIDLPEGFGDRKVDKLFQKSLDWLLSQKTPEAFSEQLNQFNSFLGEQGLSPDAFTSYAATKLDNAERFDLPLRNGKKDKKRFLQPDEYRTLLGLTKVE